MSTGRFFELINRRYFFVISYRLILNGLILLNICNLIFLTIASFLFFNRGQNVFYATSGDSSPIKLSPLVSPNYTATPLLADDIPGDEGPNINLLN